MNRTMLLAATLALLGTALAGCLGDGDVNPAIPNALVSVTPVASQPDTFRFDASQSTGSGLTYLWDFGDGTNATEAVVEHHYVYGSGTYAASLLIRDPAGITATWKGNVVVGSGENGAPWGDFRPSTRYLAVGEPLTVDASASSDPEADPLLYKWDFNFINMDALKYERFRAAKSDTSPADDSGMGKSDPGLLRDLEGLLRKDLGHPGHDSGNYPVSFFAGERESTTPVFTLAEGFPDATQFYVKLTVVDIKGKSETIRSEQIWPVLVVDAKESSTKTESITGSFTLGAPSAVTDETPKNDENYKDRYTWRFTIDRSVLDMYLNVTWNKNPLSVHEAVPYANDIDIEIFPPDPNATPRHEFGVDDSGISLRVENSADLGYGEWRVVLYAAQGFDIEYTASYWALMDMNPYRELEAPYQTE